MEVSLLPAQPPGCYVVQFLIKARHEGEGWEWGAERQERAPYTAGGHKAEISTRPSPSHVSDTARPANGESKTSHLNSLRVFAPSCWGPVELLKTFLCLGWYGRPQPCTEAGGKTGTGSREVNCSSISSGVSGELHHLHCSQVGRVRSKQWKNMMFGPEFRKLLGLGVLCLFLFCLVWFGWFGLVFFLRFS